MILGAQLAAELIHDLARDRQAEPGADALGLGGEEGLEHAAEVLGRDARPASRISSTARAPRRTPVTVTRPAPPCLRGVQQDVKTTCSSWLGCASAGEVGGNRHLDRNACAPRGAEQRGVSSTIGR